MVDKEKVVKERIYRDYILEHKKLVEHWLRNYSGGVH